jgi:hypothetical protein
MTERSLRVAVVGRVVIIVIFFAVAFLFVFFLVWLLSKDDCRRAPDQKGASRGIQDVFCSCSMVRLVPLVQTQR